MIEARAVCTALCVTACLPAAIRAQNYPTHPVRIVTSDAGGGADVSARVIAQAIAPALGQQVVIDNRGGGVIAGEIVARAPADGYTLLYYGSTLWLTPLMRARVPFDVNRDFAPVVLATLSPGVLVVHPGVSAQSVSELIALAKAQPGKLNYASAATGTSNHLAAELFDSMAGVRMTRIPYKGNGQALNAMIAGEVQVMFPAAGSVAPHVKSGRLRALAVTGAQRSPAYPALPTIAEAALPGYEAVSIIGMLAPARTPAAIVERLNREVNAALARPEVRERFLNSGVEPGGGPPSRFAQTIASEVKRMGKVIREAGIRDE